MWLICAVYLRFSYRGRMAVVLRGVLNDGVAGG